MLTTQDGGIYNGPDIDFVSLADAQADRLSHIEALASHIRSDATAGINPAEMASWSIKLAEARSVFGQPRYATPMLDLEAAARGVAVEALALRVLSNAERFASLEAAVAGVAGRHRDAVLALLTIGDVAAYDYRAGWPSLR